jgi:hypothetical protein
MMEYYGNRWNNREVLLKALMFFTTEAMDESD